MYLVALAAAFLVVAVVAWIILGSQSGDAASRTVPAWLPTCDVVTFHSVNREVPPIEIDGVALLPGMIVALGGQRHLNENGIYVVDRCQQLARHARVRNGSHVYVISRRAAYVCQRDRMVPPDGQGNHGYRLVSATEIADLPFSDEIRASKAAWTFRGRKLYAPRYFSRLSQCRVTLDDGSVADVLDDGVHCRTTAGKCKGRRVEFDRDVRRISLR